MLRLPMSVAGFLCVTVAVIVLPIMVHDSLGATIARWDFDELSGQTIVDDSDNGLNGFLGSTPGSDVEDPERIVGLDGSPGALRIGGSGFAQIPYSSALQPSGSITVSALIRPSVDEQRRRIVSNLERLADNVFSGFNLDIQLDHLRFQIFSASGQMDFVLAAFDFKPGVVYEVAGSWNQAAGIMDVFVDGVSLSDAIVEGSRFTTIDQIGPNSHNLFIGSTSFGPGEFFLGDIDRVMLDTTPLAVPEPSTLAMVILGGLAMQRRMRRDARG